jgi:iron complex outermembrane receptor protein
MSKLRLPTTPIYKVLFMRSARLHRAVLFSVVALGSLVPPAFAMRDQSGQQPASGLKQLSLAELGDLEVTTMSKAPETVWRTAAAIYVITQEDIRRSGATTIPEVLRLAPGVDVARISSDNWSVGVRGFGDQFSKSVLVMIDGRSVYTPLFAGVFWAVEDTVLEDVDRIEVIRGPGGTIWGANAVNGVINIITKSAGDTSGALASIGGGSVDQGLATFRYGGERGKDFAYRVYAKGFSRGPELHTDQLNFDDWRMAQTGFRADWSRPRDHLTLQGDVFKGEDGQIVSIGSYAPPAEPINYDPLHVSGGDLLLRWQRSLAGAGDIQLQADYDRTYFLGPHLGEIRNTFDVDFIHHVARLRRHGVTWGLGARRSPSHIIQTVPTWRFVPADQSNDLYSAFVQDEVEAIDQKLWLTFGSKFEHNVYTGLEIQPTVRLLWTPGVRQSWWAAVTRAVRTPSRLEEEVQVTQFVTFVGTLPAFVRLTGNPDFRPERLLAYEAGYRSALTPQLYVDLSLFLNAYHDLETFGAQSMALETSPPPTHLVVTTPYANGAQGQSRGLEVTLDWQPTPWWQLKGSYSFVNVDLNSIVAGPDLGGVIASYEGSSPRHQMLVRSLVSLPRGWQLDQAYRYVSALPARLVPSYVAVDVRLGWHVADHVDLSVSGQNLFDADHTEFSLNLGPPVVMKRSVYASVAWRSAKRTGVEAGSRR